MTGASLLFDVQINILKLIATSPSMNTVFDSLCRRIEDIVPDSACSVMQYDKESGRLLFGAAPSLPQGVFDAMDGLVPGEKGGACGAAIHRGEMVIIEDTWRSVEWKTFRHLTDEFGIRACWSFPVFDSDGAPLGTFAIARTQTGRPSPAQLEVLEAAGFLLKIALERDDRELERQKQNTLLDTILSSAEDPISAHDREGRYLLANRAEAIGRCDDPAEMFGRHFQEFYDPTSAATLTELTRSVRTSGIGEDREIAFDNPTAGRRRFLIRTSPLRNRGQVVGTVSVGRDVTQLRRTEAAMLKTQKLESLGVLAGGIAHDFNNILTGVFANLDLCLRETSPSDLRYARLKTAMKSATQAADLVEKLLASSGATRPNRLRISLSSLAREAYKLVKGTVERKADVAFDDEEGLPDVWVDPVQMRQVIVNLLLNASDAMARERGRILVTTSSGTGPDGNTEVRLQVRDTGCGMEEDTVRKIFDPFFTTKGDGHGLGLAAVQGIVKSHDGKIEVESYPGAGTSFELRFHAAEAEDLQSADPEGRATILIVDDEEIVLDTAREVLKLEQYNVISASDGPDAVAQFEQSQGSIDLVVLDRTLPLLSGVQVLERIRSLRPDVNVILASGHPPDGDTDGLDCRYLRKPYSATDLVSLVREALSSPGPDLSKG